MALRIVFLLVSFSLFSHIPNSFVIDRSIFSFSPCFFFSIFNTYDISRGFFFFLFISSFFVSNKKKRKESALGRKRAITSCFVTRSFEFPKIQQTHHEPPPISISTSAFQFAPFILIFSPPLFVKFFFLLIPRTSIFCPSISYFRFILFYFTLFYFISLSLLIPLALLCSLRI